MIPVHFVKLMLIIGLTDTLHNNNIIMNILYVMCLIIEFDL